MLQTSRKHQNIESEEGNSKDQQQQKLTAECHKSAKCISGAPGPTKRRNEQKDERVEAKCGNCYPQIAGKVCDCYQQIANRLFEGPSKQNAVDVNAKPRVCQMEAESSQLTLRESKSGINIEIDWE